MKFNQFVFKIIISVSLVLSNYFLIAQSLTPQVVASGGNSVNNNGISFDWTVGEACISTLSNSNLILTQGFHQPDFSAIQMIDLFGGWNGISSWLTPANKQVSNVFGQLSGNLVLVRNQAGLYWPAQNVNTLGNWDSKESFEIKVNSASSVQLRGFPVSDQTFQLNQGWNYLPVLSRCAVSVTDVAAGIPEVEIIKGIATSEVYWPQFGINTIGNLHPGKAYFVRCNQATTIMFPACSGIKSEVVDRHELIPENCPWQVVKPNPLTHLIAILADLVNTFSSQDFVGIFSSGQCVGVTQISDEVLNSQSSVSLTAFADDPMTIEKDGFIAGDEMELRVFQSDTGNETFVIPTWDNALPDHENLFAINGLSALKNVEMLTTGQKKTVEEIRLFPNPADEFVNIACPSGKAVKVSFYNQMGELCLEIQIWQPLSSVDISNLVSGVYMVVISFENDRVIKKLVVD